MKITTICTYDGTEQYTKKNNEQITLHRFKNQYGEIDKKRNDEFECEHGHKCVLTYLKGHSYKTGKDYCFLSKFCKIEDFKEQNA